MAMGNVAVTNFNHQLTVKIEDNFEEVLTVKWSRVDLSK